eukprot:TRINITY_DN1269_c1_g3_i4.p3 TRINITY_DN1269_c1_g3~~TRINITY_DN1269_c1_g3_i4.p3  ORF type:complete len:261 (-),score=30.90 TRINITY_DN1269_c1_g3_i4:297-1079(-)
MSQLTEKHSMSKLVGAPPGYVGYGTGGLLTDPIKRTPHCILLLENVNYAHSDIIDLIATLLESGQITDATGKTVNFAHTIILMTTTMSEERCKTLKMGQQTESSERSILSERQNGEESNAAVGASIDANQPKIRPPSLPQKLVERVDNLLLLNSLSSKAYQQIVQSHLDSLVTGFTQQGINLRISDNAVNYLTQIGERQSAHGIERMVRQKVMVPVGKAVVNSGFAEVLTQIDAKIQVQVEFQNVDDIRVYACDVQEEQL